MRYLVVDDDVDGPAGGERRELAEGEGLVDDALAGKGRVAVQHHLSWGRGHVSLLTDLDNWRSAP
jgi:hypothetical protein